MRPSGAGTRSWCATRTGSRLWPPNGASEQPPAWWLNLRAERAAEALVNGRWAPVRARQATEEEAEQLWPGLVEIYRGYDHYREIVTRELPVVILEPR